MRYETEFKISLRAYMRQHPQLRRGQAAFNLMHQHYPEVANKYAATEQDPFYHDERTDEFVRLCFEDIAKEDI